MNKHTLTTTYKTEGGSLAIKSEDIECDLSVNVEREGLEPGTTAEFDVNVPFAKIKGFGVAIKRTAGEKSSLSAIATVKTNSASVPDNTFTDLKPGSGTGWTQLDPVNDNPITADITKIYVQNTGDAKIDFQARFGIDSTPDLEG